MINEIKEEKYYALKKSRWINLCDIYNRLLELLINSSLIHQNIVHL